MPIELVTDSLIGEAVINLMRGARERITIVSPYNRRWDDVADELANARARGVRVTVYYRRDTPDPAQYWRGVTSFAVDWLHAKIYANERDILITSLNVGERSMRRNREIGLLVRDFDLREEIEDYIDTLGETGNLGDDEDWDDEDWDDEEDEEEPVYEEPRGKIHVLESEWHYENGPQRKTYTSCGKRARRGWEIVRDGSEWENMLRDRNMRQRLCKICIGPSR